MKTHTRRQQHKKIKRQDRKQKEPPQKYRPGTISNTKLLAGLNQFYMAITSPSAKCAYPLVTATFPRTSSIVQLLFSFWSFETSEGVMRNQKVIID